MTELGLVDAIQQLRREITNAARTAENDPLQFTLGSVELELEVELVASASTKADFKWVVVSVGAEASGERTRAHRVKLTLTPKLDGRDVKVSDQRKQPD